MCRDNGRRMLCVLAVTLTAVTALFGASAPPASAGVDRYCGELNLPPLWSCAGPNARTGTVWLNITTNHTGCAALAYGYAGINMTPHPEDTGVVACTAGSGTTGACVYIIQAAHGAVYNPNRDTSDYISEAHMTYGLPWGCAMTGSRATADGSGLSDPALQGLHSSNPDLTVAGARRVLSDTRGTVWVTTANDGDVCLVESVSVPTASTSGATVTSRFSCNSASVAAEQGVIGGAPGSFYGLAPVGVRRIVAMVNGERTLLPTDNRAFRIPANATSVIVGDGAPITLPGGPGSR